MMEEQAGGSGVGNICYENRLYKKNDDVEGSSGGRRRQQSNPSPNLEQFSTPAVYYGGDTQSRSSSSPRVFPNFIGRRRRHHDHEHHQSSSSAAAAAAAATACNTTTDTVLASSPTLTKQGVVSAGRGSRSPADRLKELSMRNYQRRTIDGGGSTSSPSLVVLPPPPNDTVDSLLVVGEDPPTSYISSRDHHRGSYVVDDNYPVFRPTSSSSRTVSHGRGGGGGRVSFSQLGRGPAHGYSSFVERHNWIAAAGGQNVAGSCFGTKGAPPPPGSSSSSSANKINMSPLEQEAHISSIRPEWGGNRQQPGGCRDGTLQPFPGPTQGAVAGNPTSDTATEQGHVRPSGGSPPRFTGTGAPGAPPNTPRSSTKIDMPPERGSISGGGGDGDGDGDGDPPASFFTTCLNVRRQVYALCALFCMCGSFIASTNLPGKKLGRFYISIVLTFSLVLITAAITIWFKSFPVKLEWKWHGGAYFAHTINILMWCFTIFLSILADDNIQSVYMFFWMLCWSKFLKLSLNPSSDLGFVTFFMSCFFTQTIYHFQHPFHKYPYFAALILGALGYLQLIYHDVRRLMTL